MSDLVDDLSDTPTKAGRAARLASRGAWGEVGSVDEPGRYAQPKADRRRGRRWCSWCEKAGRERVRSTHTAMQNGVALTEGCEWHMAVWARDGYESLFSPA